ncbi:MAG TPA: phenylalanine--tRNA ligase subunit alpha, partial [Terriglobales bacterium]|nr:phenylalanine--tRNA ligase subunit alpha [Terriglobales bacterium]
TDYSPTALDKAVAQLTSALESEKDSIQSEQEWKTLRDRWMARKNGILTQINDQWLKAAPADAKREVGQRVNALKLLIEDRVAKAFAQVDATDATGRIYLHGDIKGVRDSLRQKQTAKELPLDVTLPGIHRPVGARHPVLQAMHEIIAVFSAMGYSVEEGPEVETDYYNFEALNFPPDHPARDTQDTIFLAGQEKKPARERLLLRTHTSPVQIRTMQKHPPPVRVVCPGKVHRHDTPDASHSPLFHQVEGLAVDINITFCDLKGTLDHAMKALFGSSVKTRFYPSFFPFTEPSADVQISCPFCGGKGCRTCKQSGWIELLGCGMVDPKVFEFVRDNGYDPAKISGFAFGMGADRLAMLRYGIDDIQLLFQGDVRFLEQFA